MPLHLGPFALDAPLAQGGMGDVWRGEHARQRVPVAIKLLRGDDARLREAFFAEVRAVARLDHPGVILVLDHGIVDEAAAAESAGRLRAGAPWFAMELCTGGTLRNAVARNWNQLRRLLLDLLAPLAHAHARGVLHRDIKPDNVIFSAFDDARPGVKLTDFGLAFALEVEGGRGEVVTGTPAYMAPEQFRRAWRDYGPWTDLYALGCLAWRLATGAPPYGARRPPEVLALAHQELPLPGFQPRFEVPAGFEAWLGQLLEKDPARRTPRAGEALAALLTLDGAPPPDGHVPQGWRAAEQARVPMRLVGAGLGLWSLRGTPLVGREAERDRLWEAYREVAQTGSARVVLLHGAAGAGTSRLAEWLCERAHEAGGAEVFRVDHAPGAEVGGALGGMLARHFRVEGLGPVEARERIVRAVPGAPVEARALAALVAPDPDDTLVGATDRHGVVRRALARAAAGRPAVVRMEDVQWGGDALAFVASVLAVQADAPAPILFVLTAQAEALAERPVEALQISALVGLGAVASWIEVRPLAEREQVELVEGLLGLSGTLAEEVRRRSGGNPAFAVRLVGDWVARGVLDVGDDGFVLRAGAVAELPDDLHSTWAARLDRALAALGPQSVAGRRCLEVAVALGTEVDESEWTAACTAAGLRVPSGLVERLVLERLAAPVERDGEALVWALSHAMLRESVARGAAEAGRLSAAHRACAAMLLDRREAPDVAERLGRHLLASGAHADALGFLLRGARARAARGELRPAHALLAAREDTLRALGAPPADPRRGDGRLLDGQLLLRQGLPLRAEQRADALLADARRHGWGGVFPDALVLAGDIARTRGAPTRAEEHYRQARGLYERAADERGGATCTLGLATLALHSGALAGAARSFQQAQAAFVRAGDDPRRAECLRLRAEVARRAGSLDVAESLAGEAHALHGRLGNRLGVADALFTRSEVARSRGAHEAALAGYRAALGLHEEAGSEDVGLVLARIGWTLEAQGRTADARAVLDAARAHAERHEDTVLRGLVGAVLAAMEATRGDDAALDACLGHAEGLRAAGWADPDAAEALGRAARAARDPARAARARAAARAHSAPGRPTG